MTGPMTAIPGDRHFGCTCYHPLFVFNQFGDLERCALRPGNMRSVDGWQDILMPIVARYQSTVERIAFRRDAAFAQPGMHEFPESKGIEYAFRLPQIKFKEGQEPVVEGVRSST